MSQISHIPLDESGHVLADLPCISCGYNLRGLSPDSVCPECGIPIGRSQHGNLLRFSEPGWVKQLSDGMNWIVAAIVISILIFVGEILFRRAGLGVVRTIALLPPIAFLLGYMGLTAPDPSATESGVTPRHMVRGLAFVSFILALAKTRSLFSLEPWEILAPVIGIIFMLALGRHMSQLALRIPDPTLARRTRIVVWGFLICMGIALFATLWVVLWGPTGFITVGGIALLAGVGMLVLAILSLILIIRYQRAFRRAAQMALLTWRASRGP